jgi:hypothetical protein
MYIQNHRLAERRRNGIRYWEMNDLLLVLKSLILHNHLMHSIDPLNV